MLWRVASLAFLVDQISKWAMLYWLTLPQIGQYDLLPGLIRFRIGWNYGINFGLFSSYSAHWVRWGLVAAALIIICWLWIMVRDSNDWKVKASAGLIIGGAFGNIFDRVYYGAVVDFLNISCCGIQNPFLFNIADTFIFLGAVGLIVFMKKT